MFCGTIRVNYSQSTMQMCNLCIYVYVTEVAVMYPQDQVGQTVQLTFTFLCPLNVPPGVCPSVLAALGGGSVWNNYSVEKWSDGWFAVLCRVGGEWMSLFNKLFERCSIDGKNCGLQAGQRKCVCMCVCMYGGMQDHGSLFHLLARNCCPVLHFSEITAKWGTDIVHDH